jgi:hypothetical protein
MNPIKRAETAVKREKVFSKFVLAKRLPMVLSTNRLKKIHKIIVKVLVENENLR